jgi:hypothetical protein
MSAEEVVAEVKNNCTGKRTRTRLGRPDRVPCSDLNTRGFLSENSHSQVYLYIFLDEPIWPQTRILLEPGFEAIVAAVAFGDRDHD